MIIPSRRIQFPNICLHTHINACVHNIMYYTWMDNTAHAIQVALYPSYYVSTFYLRAKTPPPSPLCGSAGCVCVCGYAFIDTAKLKM